MYNENIHTCINVQTLMIEYNVQILVFVHWSELKCKKLTPLHYKPL